MADYSANQRQQKAMRLLTLAASGQFADAAYECCSPNVSHEYLRQQLQSSLSAGGVISWIEPIQILPQDPPKSAAPLCLRLCVVFLRYAFGRGQAVYDIGFGTDDRIVEVVPDQHGYHLVPSAKHPGSFWSLEKMPDKVLSVRTRVECTLAMGSKQVLAFPVPPHIENCQTGVSLKTTPEGASVLAKGSNLDKAHFVVADSFVTPVVVAEIQFQYSRRYLTLRTPQAGTKMPIVHLHETLKKQFVTGDPLIFNFLEPQFQQFLQNNGLRVSYGEDEVFFAHRVMKFMAQRFTYNQNSLLSKTGGAVAICLQTDIDSASHAVLFVSILRANSIPARVLVGRWVPTDFQYQAFHCRAEFFADNVGWVPVETTEKQDVLYFGSDAKTPFLTVAFGDARTFPILSTTSYAYGASLPSQVTLNWREPNFTYIAGNLTQMASNTEQWSSVVNEVGAPPVRAASTNVVGPANQAPVRYSKGHVSGAPPDVGARSRPNSVAPGLMTTHAPTSSYQPPPPIPARRHNPTVQVMTYHSPTISHAPPPLPPHSPVNYNQAPPPVQTQYPPQYNNNHLPAHHGYQPNPAPYQQPPIYQHPASNPSPPPQQQQNIPSYQQPPQPAQYAPWRTPQSNNMNAPIQSNPAEPQQPQLSQPAHEMLQNVSIAPPQPVNGGAPKKMASGTLPKAGIKAGNMKAPLKSGTLPPATAKSGAFPPGPVKSGTLAPSAKSGTLPPAGNAKAGSIKAAIKQFSSTPEAPVSSQPQVSPRKLSMDTAPSANAVYNSFKPQPKKTGAPSVPSEFFARALFDHNPQDSQEILLRKGDIIRVLVQDDSGWWKAEKFEQVGLVPAPYLEALPSGTRVAKSMYEFNAVEPNDLPLKLCEYLIILNDVGDWWQAEAHGAAGNIPANYIEECK